MPPRILFVGLVVTVTTVTPRLLIARSRPRRRPIARPTWANTNACCRSLPEARCLYVVGLESTGTRFVSREIASMRMGPHNWTGEVPACVTADDLHLHHLSLPFGGVCSATTSAVVVKDSGGTPPICSSNNRYHSPRWILNVSTLLAHRPNCRLVYLVRNDASAHGSRARRHCFDQAQLLEEERTSHEILEEAMERYPSRVLRVSTHRPAPHRIVRPLSTLVESQPTLTKFVDAEWATSNRMPD